jgi:hypothetical protein
MSRLSLAAFPAERGDMTGAHVQCGGPGQVCPQMTVDQRVTRLTELCTQKKHRPVKLIAGLRTAMASTGSTQ